MSPYVSTLLAQTAATAGLPSGALNLLLGTGDGAGKRLLEAKGVSAVSFTGSSRAGAYVATVSAERGLRYQTEMGGKNAAIVLKDGDLDRAANLTAAGAMRFAGQKCTATSRVIVAKEVAEDFRKKLEQAIKALPIGPVEDSSAAVGPLISESALIRLRQVRAGLAEDRIFEAPLPADDRFARGFFFAPTVVYGADSDSMVANSELFGPILVAFEAEDLDHAIQIANQTPYGLSATLFTSNVSDALRYIHRIQAGMVRVNGDTTGVDPHAPFGGMKASSSGSREQGPSAREFYTQIKTVEVRT
jgi:acyl-CoA reductase-like NAD-dependent aldehyde dehydrogenase